MTFKLLGNVKWLFLSGYLVVLIVCLIACIQIHLDGEINPSKTQQRILKKVRYIWISFEQKIQTKNGSGKGYVRKDSENE